MYLVLICNYILASHRHDLNKTGMKSGVGSNIFINAYTFSLEKYLNHFNMAVKIHND